MLTRLLRPLLASALIVPFCAWGADDVPAKGKLLIPRHAIVLHGDTATADSAVIGVYYSREGLDFSDAGAPRFLLLDSKGKVAFGLGGSLYATASYDFKGAIDSYGFTTYNIPVPEDQAQRQRFGAGASSSSLFAKLVGRSPHFGIFSVYFKINFNGDGGKYGARLKQAYATLGHLTAGLTTSTFVDAAVQAPTIDTEGASGELSDKSMLFRYTTPTYKGWSGAVSAEVPSATYTTVSGQNMAIPQRVPDIPVYVQYAWGKGSHVRVSSVGRALAWRRLYADGTGSNKLTPAWGVKLSAIAMLGQHVQPFGHISYGKGISSFINDLGGNGYDLIPSDTKPGTLEPAKSLTYTVGTYIYLTKSLFATASVSKAQVYGCGVLGPDGYKYGTYAAANVFYDFDATFRIGAEYLHGCRANYSGLKGDANRVDVLLQYNF